MATPEDRISFPQYICLIFFVKNSCYEGSWNDVIASDEFVAQNYINKGRVNNCLMSVGASVWASLAGNELSLTAEITCAIPDERDSAGVPQSLSVTLPSGTQTTLDASSEGKWFILAASGSLSGHRGTQADDT